MAMRLGVAIVTAAILSCGGAVGSRAGKDTVATAGSRPWPGHPAAGRFGPAKDTLLTGTRVLGQGVRPQAGSGPQDDARGGVGWGPDSAYGRLFDPATVETVRGEVTVVDLINPRKGMECGVCFTLRTEEEELAVHLGPERYISRKVVGIELHDQIEVTGSRIVFKGAPVIIVAELRKGDATFVLRDADGVPVWSDRGRGRSLAPGPVTQSPWPSASSRAAPAAP